MADEPKHVIAESVGTTITAHTQTGRAIGTGAVGMAVVYNPPPDESSIYALVGRVASEWSHYKYILDLIFWDLADLPGSIHNIPDNRKLQQVQSHHQSVV